MSFNARIDKVKIANYNTKPQNLPQFQNPFLLLSDTEALNKILDGGSGRVQNPAGDLDNEVMGSNVKTNPPPQSRMPTQSAERLATGRARITQPTAPVIIPTANRDNPSTSMPDRFPSASREGLFDNLSDDGESGDEGVHGGMAYPTLSGNTQDGMEYEAPADEMGDEGHSRVIPTTPNTPATAPLTPATAPLTPATTTIANSPNGAGRTIEDRMKTREANFNNDGSLREANQPVVATHPPIVPVTDRITNNVGISNSLISSLYDKLTAGEKSKLSTRSSYGFVRSADYPQLQTIFPSAFRRGKQIQTYRLTSGGNVYAYVYGGQSKPIYIGNWRESYRINKPPAYQPTNPHSTTRTRTAPVTTQLGNRGTRFNQP